MRYLLVGFLFSFLGCLFFIRLNLFYDVQEGVQKFHTRPTPRIGGLAIYLASLLVSGLFFLAQKPFARELFLVLLSAFPVFLGGLLEDILKKVPPRWRLFSGFLSGALAFFLVSARVSRVDLPLFDNLLSFSLFSLIFTAFAFAGVAHAFNIIDGFNGLASGVAMLIFGAYAYVSFLNGDFFLLYLSLILFSATLGFFLWNYPFGLIFLGDGGAYFLGFMAATIGALLVKRHSGVSPWFPLLLVVYPVWETLFSIYRRKFLKSQSPFLPDAIHFHTFVYRRLVKFFLGGDIEDSKRNAYTSPFLWIMELMCLVPAVLFWRSTPLLMLFVLSFIAFYTWLYFRIVRFKTPKIFRAFN
ncbi:glycosyltransferase [Thermosulfurimonas marina]|uniref:Glycosyltransferase n=1 Tax=Thermosulfurimonas marina TaxID=2047767 RepID=A0A6H1WTN5_9BACT|nr:glycosyltransferase [Thermosulfurimonas marina]QJA06540.1 glycosyltransferase [Thermosulfurimonas marina]